MSINSLATLMLTKNDIKQEISYIYLHALVTQLGYVMERPCIDRDSIDASIWAKGEILGSKGIIRSPKVDVQLKATVQDYSGNDIPFKLSKKNYDDLRQNTMVPRILIVIFLSPSEEWIDHDLEKILLYGTGYWTSLKGMEATENLSDKTIYLPQSQRLTSEVIRQWMISAANREEIAYVSC